MGDWTGLFGGCGGRESGERGIQVHGGSCSLEVKLRCDPQSLPSPWGNELKLPLDGFSTALLWPRVRSPGETFSEVNWEGQPTQQGPALPTQAANQWHRAGRDLENGNRHMNSYPRALAAQLCWLASFPPIKRNADFSFLFPLLQDSLMQGKLLFST